MRIATESDELRPALLEHGFDVRNTLGINGLLLGRPASAEGVGTAQWVLYESSSIVLRRSPRLEDAIAAARFHLSVLASATRAPQCLPLLTRTLVLPDGRVWLTDPYVAGDMPGLDRQLLRAGVTVLPTAIAAYDPARSEIVLPPQAAGDDLPTGRLPVERIMLRTVPGVEITGAEELRLARLVARHESTNLADVLDLVLRATATGAVPVELLDAAEIEAELGQLPTLASERR